jgi:hypothetical protein
LVRRGKRQFECAAALEIAVIPVAPNV